MISVAVVEFLAILPVLLLLAAVYGYKWWADRQPRRDPLTTDLRRLPADSLMTRLDLMRDKGLDLILTATMVGGMSVVLIVLRRLPADIDWRLIDTLVLLGSLAVSGVLGQRLVRLLPELARMRAGIRAEQAVAQELAEMLAGRNRIIHDVQAKQFNIDHVVITPGGIFAVETKSRLKPATGQGSESVKVLYDGKGLKFPGWMETEPVEQARRQADWLARHLQAATGERLPVVAVLALPGWYVENTARITNDMVRVINPKNASWLFVKRPPVLDDAALQRAIHAVEKLAAVPAKD